MVTTKPKPYQVASKEVSIRPNKLVKNNGGGQSYKTDIFTNLDRFLILGSESGTYYVRSKDLTTLNTENILRCIKDDPNKTLNRILEINKAGRAPKRDPALFALALLCTYATNKSAAYSAIKEVCNIPTDLFKFVGYIKNLRKWSYGLLRGLSAYYKQPIEKLQYHAVKYRNREGWTHRDLLRMIHTKPISTQHQDLFSWLVGKNDNPKSEYLQAFLKLQKADIKEACDIIIAYKFSHEAVPNELLTERKILEALAVNMPYNATLRFLNRFTIAGVNLDNIRTRIIDQEQIKKSRIHPLAILNTMKQYSSGKGLKGNKTWTPVQDIVDALQDAFYQAFNNVDSTGKKICLAVDVSGSMSWNNIAGMNITPREAAAVLALVLKNNEPNSKIMGFSRDFVELRISPKQRLDDVLSYMDNLPMDATDCSLPMVWAKNTRQEFNAFVILTDSETNSNTIPPSEALRQYNRNAKCVVVGMTATDVSIAEPGNLNMMDVVGFDTAVPQLIGDFIS